MRLIEGAVGGKELVALPPLPDDPGARRLRDMLDAQRQALVAPDPGTRLGEDAENLHQHRVAARRTRAILRATRRYVDDAWRASIVDPLAELGEATGPVRDLDVLLEHVRDEVAELGEPDRAGADGLVARLDFELGVARRRLLEALEGESYRTLLTRLRAQPRLAPRVEAVPLERIARKEFGRLVKAVGRLGKHPEEAALHRLRILLKRARYAAELSAPEGDAGARFLADAKRLQDLLGEHQDAVVAEERLRAAAVIGPETATAFVAGRLAERQRARRARVRELLPGAWKRLRKSGARLD